MNGTLKIDFAKRLIIMDRTYAKNVSDTNSEEYSHLQEVRRDYPKFKVIQRTITRNVMKKTYAGLTYEYMKKYIRSHETEEQSKAVIAELDELIIISKCHGKAYRYPVIKKWFFEKYPDVQKYGLELQEEKIDAAQKAKETFADYPSLAQVG